MRTRSPSHTFIAVLLAALAVGGSFAAAAGAQQPDVTALQSSDQGLELCRDAAGELRAGAFDVLLLIDDSGSLQATRNPTDPDGIRFEALRVLLEGLGRMGEDARDVNIAAVSFGARLETLLPFQRLEPEDVGAIVVDIQRAATGRQPLTDYVTGVGRGIDLLADRPVENCRVLVWFTDGEHDVSNSTAPAADAADAAGLREAFCRPGGLRERIQAQGINTFVLLLNPAGSRPASLDASQDVMQVITGDRDPEFPGAGASARSPSGECRGPLGPTTGLILPVSEADQLPGIFADVPNIIDGGVAPIACPYRVDDVDTGPLPDGHLIEWISLTDYASGSTPVAPTLTNIEIILQDEVVRADQILEVQSLSAPSARFRIREEARERLRAGWTLRVTEAENLCLRLRAVVPQFRISTTDPQVVAVQPRGLPVRLFEDGRLQFRSLPAGDALTLDAALRVARVAANLRVEHGQIFSDTSTIPARVIVDGAPVQGEGCTAFQIPAPGTFAAISARGSDRSLEAPLDPLRSSTCVVTPATLGDGGVIDWSRTLRQLNDTTFACQVGDWAVYVDGQEVRADSLDLAAGQPAVRIELRSSAAPANTELDCTGISVEPIELTWQGRPADIPVTLSVAWLKRSNPLIAAAIATPLVLLVILLSLGLLWIINERWMRPPDPAKLWGFEADGRLVLDGRGAFTIRWNDEDSALSVASDNLQRVSGYERGGLRTERSARLQRRMPPILRPLAEPVLELEVAGQDRVVVSHPPAPSGQGALPMGFREALVLSAPAGRLPDATTEVPVRLVALVPKQTEVAGSAAIERVLERHLPAMTDLIVERLRGSGGTAASSRGAKPGTPASGGPPSPAEREGPAGTRGLPPGDRPRSAGPPSLGPPA